MISARLKILFVFSILGAVLVTLVAGWYTWEAAPPYPGSLVAADGRILTSRENILQGQTVWQKYGLMDNGSVWGHGTYRGNDYTATSLHLLGRFMRQFHARSQYGRSYQELEPTQQLVIDRAVIAEIKKNGFDQEKDELLLSAAEAAALEQLRQHWNKVFSQGDKQTVVLAGTIASKEDRKNLADFFFWTAWAAGTLRPGKTLTYTNNWPPDRSVGNEVAPQVIMWSIASLLALMLALGGVLVLFFKGNFDRDTDSGGTDPGAAERLLRLPITASQRKTAKYFLVVVALFFLQLMQGGLMAHFTVHPGEFYGIGAVANYIPYNWPKSWHLQLAIFWIATAWVGAALYLAPLAGKKEPKGQGVLVDILFAAVVLVVIGALVGTAMGVEGHGGTYWFWFAHQGWEFLELGRFWQILLFLGLVIWLLIVARAILPALAPGEDRWGIVPFFTLSAIGIVSFFAFGLFYSPRTHLTVADFWRWWVVHTWVEGIFEFFAAAAIAYVLTSLGLTSKRKALRAAYLTASLALFSGIIGVGHHYYWFGDPDLWLALGGVVSTMEPVPIVLLLLKVALDSRHSPAMSESFPYKWPLMFVGASAGWSFLGAGVFGFIITTPVVNYYEHSTYLTMNHGHTAMFGTYGMLAIGLMLFALRGLVRPEKWSNGLLKVAFVGMNGGLFLMSVFTLLPVGFMQTKDSFVNGLWHARSPEFYNLPIVRTIGQWRMVPDLIIITGALCLLLFVIRALSNLKPAEIKSDEPLPLGAVEAAPAIATGARS